MRRRLTDRELTLKGLAKAITAKGTELSEFQVIRCLHPDEKRRIPTLEAVQAISDYLQLPRPVVVADSELEALAIQGALLLRDVDSDQRKVSVRLPTSPTHRQTKIVDAPDASREGESEAIGGAVGRGGSKASSLRSRSVRSSSRAR